MDVLLVLALYVAVIAGFLYLDRKNWEFSFPIFMRRSQKGVAFINKIGQKYSKLWKAYGTIGAVVCVIVSFLMLDMLAGFVLQVANNPSLGPGAKLLLPIQTDSEYTMYIPWYYFFIAVTLLMIVHEFSHGFVAAAQKLKIKSIGAAFLLIIPGAFVEPDEEKLKKTKRWDRMRVYAAGSWANIIVAFLAFVLLSFVVTPIIISGNTFGGVQIISVVQNSSADNAGVVPGLIVNSINGEKIETINDFQSEIFKIKPGDTTVLETNNGTFEVLTAQKKDDFPLLVLGSVKTLIFGESYKPYLGVGLKQEVSAKEGDTITKQIFEFAFGLLYWIFLVNLGVGMFNLIPVRPLDGGYLIADIIEKVFPKKISSGAIRLLSTITLVLLLLTFFGSTIINFLR